MLKKINDFFSGENKKKNMENLTIVVIISVISLIFINILSSKNTSKKEPVILADNSISEKSNDYDIEKKLENILSQIYGVGRVSVMVSYLAGSELVPITDVKQQETVTQEKDKGGGERVVNENDHQTTTIMEEKSGTKTPYISKEIMPIVSGVIVVADGAGDVNVKEKIIKSVEAVTNVSSNKIEVLQRKSE